MEFDRRTRYDSTGPDAAPSAPVPGKQTLTQGMVQLHPAAAPSSERAGVASSPPLPMPAGPRPTLQMLFGRRDRASDPEQVHAAAARGTATAAGQLPHLEQIQRSFGKHDVSGVQAHVGAEAAASAQEMGAAAYATGNHVVLGAGTDLHTVAHEAAHVVQQRAGVQLKGGVGEVGDAYERQADEVADRVVRGTSAVDLLDAVSPAGHRAADTRPTGVIQRSPKDAQDFLSEKGVEIPLPTDRAKFIVLLDRLLNEGKIDLAALETALHRFDVTPSVSTDESVMLPAKFDRTSELGYQHDQDFVSVANRAPGLESMLQPWDHDLQEGRAVELKRAQTIENCLRAMYNLRDQIERSEVNENDILPRSTEAQKRLGREQMALRSIKTRGMSPREVLDAQISALEEQWHTVRYAEMDRRTTNYDTMKGRAGHDSGSTARGPYGKPGLIGRRPMTHESNFENRDTLWLQGHGDWRMPTATAERATKKPSTPAQSGVEGGFFTMEQVLAAANLRLATKLQSDLREQIAPKIDPSSFEVVFIAPHGTPSKTSENKDGAGPYDIVKLNQGMFSMPFLELVEGSDTFLIPNYSLGRRENRHSAPEWQNEDDQSSAKNFGVSDMDTDVQIQDPRSESTLRASLLDIMIQVLATEAEKQVRRHMIEGAEMPEYVRAAPSGRKLRFAWVNCRVESDSVVWLRSELRKSGSR